MQDHDCIPLDGVANDVGIGADQLPHGSASHGPPAVREMVQAVPESLETRGELPRGSRIELLDIGTDRLKCASVPVRSR